MEKYSGISVVKGIAIGRIYLCKKKDYEVTDQRVPDIDAEMERFLAAKEEAEEQQFESYRAVLEKMGGKRVVVRTMDIGADKKVDYFHFEPEENPAMGYRGIRICLDRVGICGELASDMLLMERFL